MPAVETLQWQIVGLRNRLIHGDDTVDFDLLWRIIEDDLPGPLAELDRQLG
ncbi:MAG: HepT-like ribonuclease domain-containing protein [Deltaproteobacteria bacterium]